MVSLRANNKSYDRKFGQGKSKPKLKKKMKDRSMVTVMSKLLEIALWLTMYFFCWLSVHSFPEDLNLGENLDIM